MTLSVDNSQINFNIARVSPYLNENYVSSRICCFIYSSYFITINIKNEFFFKLLCLNILSIYFFRLQTSLKQQHCLLFKHSRKLCKIHDNNLLSSVLVKCLLMIFIANTSKIYIKRYGIKKYFLIKKNEYWLVITEIYYLYIKLGLVIVGIFFQTKWYIRGVSRFIEYSYASKFTA